MTVCNALNDKAGSLIFLASSGFPASTNPTFSLPITYNNFLIKLSRQVSTNDYVKIVFSTDNGVTYLSTGYKSGSIISNNASTTWINVNVSTSWQFMQAATKARENGNIYLYNCTSGSGASSFLYRGGPGSGTTLSVCTNSSLVNTPVTNIQFQPTNSQAATGMVYLYGIKES